MKATERLGGRVLARIIKPVVIDAEALVNAWPEGARTIACLWCDRPFTSSGRQERMCQSCRRHTL